MPRVAQTPHHQESMHSLRSRIAGSKAGVLLRWNPGKGGAHDTIRETPRPASVLSVRAVLLWQLHDGGGAHARGVRHRPARISPRLAEARDRGRVDTADR